MSASTLRPAAFVLALVVVLGARAAEYRYDGRLDDFGQPANGRYDIELSVFGGETAGKALAAALTFPGVEVRDGRFRLDFDVPLAGSRETWVQLAVRASGDANFSTIPGRSKAISAPLIGACWSTTGDTGSSAATNFLGTTDAQPLVIKTANVQSLRIEPSSILSGGNPITANVIAGSSANNVTAGVRGATIAGGGVPAGASDPDYSQEAPNRVTDHYGTVSGGYGNRAGDDAGTELDQPFGTVAGGADNVASGAWSVVGGGGRNLAISDSSTVGGGVANNASGQQSTVGGGGHNAALYIAGTVGGGEYNTAAGYGSTVSGGTSNCAGGAHSWAGGQQAKIRPGSDPGSDFYCTGLTYPGGEGDYGTFVWADKQYANFVSTGPNQFLVRAAGGAVFNRNALVDPAVDDFVIATRAASSGADADADLRLVSRGARSASIYLSDGNGTLTVFPADVTAGDDRLRVLGGVGGAATLSNGGTWNNASSRTFKQDFQPVDGQDVLARVLDLDISRWQYIGSAEGQHMGPVAEDFHAAFGLGRSEKQIATVDADGVALAAIQGLNAKLEAENAALRDELAELRALIEARLPAEH